MRFLYLLIAIFVLGIIAGVLTGCAPAPQSPARIEAEQKALNTPRTYGLFTEILNGGEFYAPTMYELDYKGHQYIIIGNGFDEGFFKHAEHCTGSH